MSSRERLRPADRARHDFGADRMAGRQPTSSSRLRHPEDVVALLPTVLDSIHDGPDEVDAETTDWPILDVQIKDGRGHLQRVECHTVVLNFDQNLVIVERQSHDDLVPVVILEAVHDDVGHEFVEREIDVEHSVGRQPVLTAELLDKPAETLNLGAVVDEHDGQGLSHVAATRIAGRGDPRAKGARASDIRPRRATSSGLPAVSAGCVGR
jgi:hypothetical protein